MFSKQSRKLFHMSRGKREVCLWSSWVPNWYASGAWEGHTLTVIPFSPVSQILLLWKGWWNEDILFVFKPDSMPSVVKDGSAPESLKGTSEAAMKYVVFWHSVTLPFTAAAKSEQLLLTFPCHFLALLKEVSSVFSLLIFPSAGHLDS